MEVFLYRIRDRPFGFSAVAVLADTEERAQQLIRERHHGQFENYARRSYAELEDRCGLNDGEYVRLEHEE